MPTPAGPVGPVWTDGSWPDTVWAQGAWGATLTPRPTRPSIGGVLARETPHFPVVRHLARGASMAAVVVTPFSDWRRLGAGAASARAWLEQVAVGQKRIAGASRTRCAVTLTTQGAANNVEDLLALYLAYLTRRH